MGTKGCGVVYFMDKAMHIWLRYGDKGALVAKSRLLQHGTIKITDNLRIHL